MAVWVFNPFMYSNLAVLLFLDARRAPNNNTKHPQADLRVFLKWMIVRSGSVIIAVRLKHQEKEAV